MGKRVVKLTDLAEYATAGEYIHGLTGESVTAFQIQRKDIRKRPPPGDRMSVEMRVVLPDYRDEKGALTGEGGSVSGWHEDWMVKRGEVWTSIDPETFGKEYRRKS